jgi:hypothetical protein
MADDVILPGTGQTIASKENAGKQYQEMLVVEKDTYTPINPAIAEKQQAILDLLTDMVSIGLNKADGSPIDPSTSELQQSILTALAGLFATKIVKADGSAAVNPATSELQQAILDELAGLLTVKLTKADGVTAVNPATSEDISNADIMHALKILIQVIASPPTTDKALNQIRTAPQSIPSLSGNTLGTVTTVAGVTNIDGYQGKLIPMGINNMAWRELVRSLIT